MDNVLFQRVVIVALCRIMKAVNVPEDEAKEWADFLEKCQEVEKRVRKEMSK